MNELALHILDIVQNSICAGAQNIRIALAARPETDTLELTVTDDGRGMDAELLARVTSPFVTTRTARKVGLGVPLLKMTAEMTGGEFAIESRPGCGTSLTARYVHSSVDCLPVGDMAASLTALIQQSPDLHFVYERAHGENRYVLDTDELREHLDSVPLDTPEVLEFIAEYVRENEKDILKGLK